MTLKQASVLVTHLLKQGLCSFQINSSFHH